MITFIYSNGLEKIQMLSFNNSGHNNKTVVGFNTGHHGGCTIIHDGKIISISEERLNRKKYSEGYIESFFYCLKGLGIHVSDIDLFVSSSYHKKLSEEFMGEFEVLGISKEKFITVDHHLSHAYTAFCTSPFEESLVVVVDGLGNTPDTESYYLARGNNITRIGGNNKDRSIYKGIGRAYESFTNFIGWSAQEAGKTMGLAALGKEKYPDIDLFKINERHEIESLLEGKYYHGASDFVREKGMDFGKPFSLEENKDAAFFVQDRIEKIILRLVRQLYEEYKMPNLCLSGGVFLNGIVNKKILDETPIKNVYVPPCCDDTGQPLGNALYGYCSHFGNPMNIELKHAFLGREYSNIEIIDVIEKRQEIYPLPYEVKSQEIEFFRSPDISKDVAELLSKENIIGWFQDGSEIGPRALGHRSILCSPFPAKMKDVLNERIKHRELFRPFAPAVLEEKAEEYFELDRPSPFMLLVANGRPEVSDKIPAVLHYDSSARVQTVSKETDVRFYNLISEFGKITGVPVLLNTSFNDSGEPIVETPKDALVMFCKNELDYLVIEDYILWKK